VESRRFTIRQVRIGDLVVQNVPASIGDVTSQLLLGQSVLEQLGRWSLDSRRGVMVLGERGAGESATLDAPRPSVPQTAPRLPDGLPFAVGADRADVRRRLGQPSFEMDRGYWANTTIDMFDNVVPGWLALSYLYDTSTLRVRQAEATVPPWAGVDYLSAVIARMAGRSVGSSVQRAVVAVGEQGARQADFKVGSIEGTIERQGEARIYVAVWEPGTHRR
jgi:hypothetical protein